MEKQKLLYYYGINEKQLHNYARRAAAMKGPTGLNLLKLLELRLDNVVFRMGFTPTIPAARQFVTHGLIRVNGKLMKAPSYQARDGDHIEVIPKARGQLSVLEGTRYGPRIALPDYLEVSEKEFSGKVTGAPIRKDVPIDVNETMVTEYYSQAA